MLQLKHRTCLRHVPQWFQKHVVGGQEGWRAGVVVSGEWSHQRKICYLLIRFHLASWLWPCVPCSFLPQPYILTGPEICFEQCLVVRSNVGFGRHSTTCALNCIREVWASIVILVCFKKKYIYSIHLEDRWYFFDVLLFFFLFLFYVSI